MSIKKWNKWDCKKNLFGENRVAKWCSKSKSKSKGFDTLNECVTSDKCIKQWEADNVKNQIIKGEPLIIYPSDKIKFFHSSRNKFLYPNRLANWFSPMPGTKNVKKLKLRKYITRIPIFDQLPYNYTYTLKRPIKLFSFEDGEPSIFDVTASLLNSADNIKLKEYLTSNDLDLDDYEYILAYYICKYTDYDGYITPAATYGYCILCGDTSKLLSLEKIIEYL